MKAAKRTLSAGKHWYAVVETVVWGEGGEMDGNELNHVSTSGGR